MCSLTAPEFSLLKLMGSFTKSFKADEIVYVPKPVLLSKRTQPNILLEDEPFHNS
jgi:hypothetical protein